MVTTSIARAYWERFAGPNGYEELKKAEGNLEEDEYIDFKRPDAESQKNENALSEYLSAFGNTGGGVLIIGMDSERKGGIDTARELIEIPDVEKHAQRLRDRLVYLVSPAILGADVRAVVNPDGSGRGVLVCFVPLSEARPHRDEFKKRWRMRTRKGNDDINPYMLGQMFYPKRPFAGTLRIHRKSFSFPESALPLSIAIRLDGIYMAEDAWLHIVPAWGEVKQWIQPVPNTPIEVLPLQMTPHFNALLPGVWSDSHQIAVTKPHGNWPSLKFSLHIRDTLPLVVEVRNPGEIYEPLEISLTPVAGSGVPTFDGKTKQRSVQNSEDPP